MTDSIKTIFENQDFLVIEKPAGIPVHGGPSVKERTLVDFLLEKYPEIESVGENPLRPGIVHRLDKDTSGLMIIARNQKAFNYFKNQFKNHQIEKKYLALCWGHFKNKSGTIETYIGRSTSNPTRQSQSKDPQKVRNAKHAITRYVVLKEILDKSLIEAIPKTGRMHQIRIHFHSIGHPIVGDQKYQTKALRKKNKQLPRHLLHAQSLRFTGPDGKKYFFDSNGSTLLT